MSGVCVGGRFRQWGITEVYVQCKGRNGVMYITRDRNRSCVGVNNETVSR